VLLAESRKDRRLGVLTSCRRVLIRAGCVHSVGVTEPLLLIGIDWSGTVRVRRVLGPGGFARIPEAVWMLELSIDDPGPEVGEQLNLYARRSERQADYLWNTDREPE
jgi:hypothetical protein